MSKTKAVKAAVEKSVKKNTVTPMSKAVNVTKLQELLEENQAVQVRLKLAKEDDKGLHPELARVYLAISDSLEKMVKADDGLVLEFDVLDPETTKVVTHKVNKPQLAVWPFENGERKPEACLLGTVPAAKGGGVEMGLVGNAALVTAVRPL